jgi:hypothetical protein
MCSGKEREKPSEEKPVEKPSGEKPSEQPQPKPKPKPVRFHCDYCGRDGHKGEFCFKRKRAERMPKEWANKDKYHPSNGVLEPRVQMPRAKASVSTVPAWGRFSRHDQERVEQLLRLCVTCLSVGQDLAHVIQTSLNRIGLPFFFSLCKENCADHVCGGRDVK